MCARSDSEYSPLEVRGVVSAMLESLSVDKMPDVNFVALRDACMLQVKHLLALPLKHTSLTDFDQPLLANWQGSTPPEPTPPPDLPEVAAWHRPPKMTYSSTRCRFSSRNAMTMGMMPRANRAPLCPHHRSGEGLVTPTTKQNAHL
jgi:hypothetical protein